MPVRVLLSRRLLARLATLLVGIGSLAVAGEPSPPAEQPVPAGAWWVVLVCGHPGDEEHAKLFAKTLVDIRTALIQRWGVAEEHVKLVCDQDVLTADAALACAEHASRAALTAQAETLGHTLQAADILWVIVVGHAHADGSKSWLNLRGDDVEAAEFGQMFGGLPPERQVFWITTPASEPFVKPLSRPGRVIVSATEGRHEQNETLFPRALAATLGAFGGEGTSDLDQDGRSSLLDLYLATVRATNKMYEAEMAVPTEHALLDDNGDGRATEVQGRFAEPSQQGRRTRRRPAIGPLDGEAANQQILEIKR